jgi:guanine deaminase
MIISGQLLLDPAQAPQPGWVAIDGARIAEVGDGRPPETPRLGGTDRLICPGFVDAHLHLPQIDSIGCEHGDLLTWLEHEILPAEARWADAEIAMRQARSAYCRMLRAGTIAYAGYLTSHTTGPAAVAAVAADCPLRALAGQVLMDREAPASLLGHDLLDPDTLEAANVQWSINPRFAVACSNHLLARAGNLSNAKRWVQTHLAESERECARVRELFPEAPSYTAIYDATGLLHARTLLAHCLHLTDEEWQLVAARNAVVVHCPAANTFLQAGAFDLAAAQFHGVRLGLGSDVAAGPDIAMPRVARAMIEVAKLRAILAGHAIVPTAVEAWNLITRGNAELLGFTDLGRLEPGASASLLVLRPPLPIDQHLIGRLLYNWRDDFIEHRVLEGRTIDPNDLSYT